MFYKVTVSNKYATLTLESICIGAKLENIRREIEEDTEIPKD